MTSSLPLPYLTDKKTEAWREEEANCSVSKIEEAVEPKWKFSFQNGGGHDLCPHRASRTGGRQCG